tara:strand:+ start:132 stop:1127 length:996 start_codon:yes stop_codon:yes gene_type:complete
MKLQLRNRSTLANTTRRHAAPSLTTLDAAAASGEVDLVVVLQELFLFGIVLLFLFGALRAWRKKTKRTTTASRTMLQRRKRGQQPFAARHGRGRHDASSLSPDATVTPPPASRSCGATVALYVGVSILLLTAAHVSLAVWHVRFTEGVSDRAARVRHAHLTAVLQRRISALENASRIESDARFAVISAHVRRTQGIFLNQSRKLTRMVQRKEAWSDALDANVTRMAEPLHFAAGTMLRRVNATDRRVGAALRTFEERLYKIEGQIVEVVAAQRDIEDKLGERSAASAAQRTFGDSSGAAAAAAAAAARSRAPRESASGSKMWSTLRAAAGV